MNKEKKMFVLLNIVFCIFFIVGIFFVEERRETLYFNTDTSMYSGVSNIPKIGAITNDRAAEIKFSLFDKKLYGISFFFYVSGEDDTGEISCTLQYDGENIETVTFPVKELFALSEKENLSAKEIVFKTTPSFSGEYTLSLNGKNIDSQTRISFYGNNSSENRYVNYVNGDYQEYTEVLYILSIYEQQHPYLWYAFLIFALEIIISFLFYLDNKEKKIGNIHREKY